VCSVNSLSFLIISADRIIYKRSSSYSLLTVKHNVRVYSSGALIVENFSLYIILY